MTDQDEIREAGELRTIVLGRIENTGIRKTGRLRKYDTYNWIEETEACPRSIALVWMNKGTADDELRAGAYAEAEGYEVFTFAPDEADPIGKAKAVLDKRMEGKNAK